MNLGTLLRHVRHATGKPATRNHLNRAISLGVVDPVARSASGWRQFDETHVASLIRYMQENSRVEPIESAAKDAEAAMQ